MQNLPRVAMWGTAGTNKFLVIIFRFPPHVRSDNHRVTMVPFIAMITTNHKRAILRLMTKAI